MRLRCDQHGPPDKSQTTFRYVAAVEPHNYPDTAAICGRDDCGNPGLAYLHDQQYWRYQYEDQRFFKPTHEAFLKIRVTDNVHRERSDLVRPQEYGPDKQGDWPEYPDHDSTADW